jgi:hypothetical protein
MPQKKNYSCDTSDSCSLMSVTGLSACGDSSTSPSSTLCPDSSCPSSSSLCSSSLGSSSLCSSSSCSTSEVTYSDKTSTSTSINTCTSSESSPSSPCSPCSSSSTSTCESISSKKCAKLVKKYTCSKEELLAISDIMVMLNFIKNKLVAVQPNVLLRQTQKYTVEDNINWLESFVDTLFCVLRKNEAYKVIKVKECKVKNDSDVISDNRTYLIKVKYSGKKGDVCNTIPLTFQWSQLTTNYSPSYNAVLDLTIAEIEKELKAYDAESVRPFLNN